MSTECLIAEFADRSKLSTALKVLQKANYREDDFSLVTSASGVEDSAIDSSVDRTPASPPTEETTSASTLVGGTLGAVLGTATLMGPLLVAGPLAGMAAGAVGGSLLSSVESWGVNPKVGEAYEQKVANGSSLVVIKGNDEKLREAQRLLKTCGPTSIEHFKAT